MLTTTTALVPSHSWGKAAPRSRDRGSLCHYRRPPLRPPRFDFLAKLDASGDRVGDRVPGFAPRGLSLAEVGILLLSLWGER